MSTKHMDFVFLIGRHQKLWWFLNGDSIWNVYHLPPFIRLYERKREQRALQGKSHPLFNLVRLETGPSTLAAAFDDGGS